MYRHHDAHRAPNPLYSANSTSRSIFQHVIDILCGRFKTDCAGKRVRRGVFSYTSSIGTYYPRHRHNQKQ